MGKCFAVVKLIKVEVFMSLEKILWKKYVSFELAFGVELVPISLLLI